MEEVLKSLSASDDFLLFKSVMVAENLKLEMQVRALYEAQVTKSDTVEAMPTVEAFPVAAGQTEEADTDLMDDDAILQVSARKRNPLANPCHPGACRRPRSSAPLLHVLLSTRQPRTQCAS